jgi:hypothetical protein
MSLNNEDNILPYEAFTDFERHVISEAVHQNVPNFRNDSDIINYFAFSAGFLNYVVDQESTHFLRLVLDMIDLYSSKKYDPLLNAIKVIATKRMAVGKASGKSISELEKLIESVDSMKITAEKMSIFHEITEDHELVSKIMESLKKEYPDLDERELQGKTIELIFNGSFSNITFED